MGDIDIFFAHEVQLYFSEAAGCCGRAVSGGVFSVKSYYKDQNDSGAVMLCSGRRLFGRPYTFCFPCVGGCIGQDPRYGSESSLLTGSIPAKEASDSEQVSMVQVCG